MVVADAGVVDASTEDASPEDASVEVADAAVKDAAVAEDGGETLVDASTVADSGTSTDATVGRDAAVVADASVQARDAATPVVDDPGVTDTNDEGCACEMSRGESPSVLLWLVPLVWMVRRRQRAR